MEHWEKQSLILNIEEKEKKPVSPLFAAIFVILQLTWGLPQTLVGFLLFLCNCRGEHCFHRGCIHTTWPDDLSGVSLGLFIFTGEGCIDDMRDHEFGHSVQSLILGPFYLFVIGIPSLIWNRKWVRNLKRNGRAKNYFSFFTEHWAESIKERIQKA